MRVGLYIVRAPASASRLQLAENGLLKYLAKGSLPNDRCDTLFEPAGQIFDHLEWIARATSHIPNQGVQLIHYYGAYSNAHRGKRAKLHASTHTEQAAESQAEWIKLRRKSDVTPKNCTTVNVRIPLDSRGDSYEKEAVF